MKKPLVKVMAICVCLWTGTALAGKNWTSFAFPAYLDGVDKCGSPDASLGTDTFFNASINIKNGNYTGIARGSVTNLSGSGHLYYDQCIGTINSGDVLISSSLYRVGLGGKAVLVVTGNLHNSP